MRIKRTTVTFSITLTVPPGANINQVREYIRDAVTKWSFAGSGPEGPFVIDDLTVALKKKEIVYA
jgi:hypothetical protein